MIKTFLAIFIGLPGANSFADYFDLANRQQAERQAQDEARTKAAQSVWHQRFDSTLLGLGNHFASKHGGFKTPIQSASNAEMRPQRGPNRAQILGAANSEFSTNDGNECVLAQEYYESDITGPNGYIRPALHCINAITGKHTDQAVRVR